ncbi:MAG: energy-coupling factor transporter transmembrane component T [Sulfolobales archaeon]
MIRPRPTTLFIYGLVITILAFISRRFEQLLILAVINAPVGIVLGFRKYSVIIGLFLVGLIGLFVNALIFSNVGTPVIEFYGLVIREGVLTAFINVTLRLLSILGATLVFVTQVNARDLIKSLECELGLPKTIAFATAVGLRMLSILERDLREVQLVRVERGFRKYPITPSDIGSFLRPLLSLGLERALWVGIAAELRGFSQRVSRRVGIKITYVDLIIYALLITQVFIVLIS